MTETNLESLMKDMILEEMNKGIIAVDTDFNIIYLNRVSEGVLGICRNKVLGRHVDEVFGETVGYESELPGVVRSGIGREIAKYPFGSKYLQVRMEPLRIEGQIVGGVSFIIDITDRVKEEVRLQKMVANMAIHIIPVHKEIGILPLMHIPFDTSGMGVELEAMRQCQDLGITKLIVDLTAIPYTSTGDIVNFKNTLAALRLIGVEIILTGIKPKVAIHAVNSGIDMAGSRIFSNLQVAMQYCAK